MPGETISWHFVLTNIISDDIMTIMNSYWIDSVFTLELRTTASSKVSLICTSPNLALAMTFLHSFHLWKQMDNKCEWDGKNLFLFYILQSWAVLHCWITLLLQDIYLVSILWPLLYGILISNIRDDPIMIQQLSLTSFFTNYKPNQTKPNKTIQSFPYWNSYMWVHHCCITSLFMFMHQWLYLILCISLNVLLSLARLESNCKSWYSKASSTYFFITSHCIALYLHSEATMKPIAIQSQQETLICMLMQQGLLAVAQVVVSLLLSLLIYTVCVWEAANVSMLWHA